MANPTGIKIRWVVQKVPSTWDPFLPILKDYQENYRTDAGIPAPETILVADLGWLAMYSPADVFSDPKIAEDIGAEAVTADEVKRYVLKPYSQVIMTEDGTVLRVDGVDVNDAEAMQKRRLRLDIQSKNRPRAHYATERIPFDAFGDTGLRLFETYVPSGYGQKKQLRAPMEGRKSSVLSAYSKAAYKIVSVRKDTFLASGVLEERAEDAAEMEDLRTEMLVQKDALNHRSIVLSATLNDGPEATVRVGMALLHIGIRRAEAGQHTITLLDSFTRFVQALSEYLEEKTMVTGSDKGTILKGGMRYKAIPLARALVDRFFGNWVPAGYGTVTGIMTGIIPMVGKTRDPNAESMEHAASAQIGRGTHTATLDLVKHSGPYKHVRYQLDLSSLARHAEQLRSARQQAEFEHLERIKTDCFSRSSNQRRKPTMGDEEEIQGGLMQAVEEMNMWAQSQIEGGKPVPDYEYLTPDMRLLWENVPGEQNRNHK